MLDNIGIPNSGINLSLSDGSHDLAGRRRDPDRAEGGSPPDRRVHRSSSARSCRKEFPGLTFYFAASDIVDAGAELRPAGADRRAGRSGRRPTQEKNLEIAEELARQIAAVPGAVDVHIHQVAKTPDLRVHVDRTLAGQVGLTQRDVANDLLVSLSSSGQTSPNFWLDPQTRRATTRWR